MIREKASPEYIARGWAVGMFWGFATPLGVQLIFSIPCSFLLKGSKIGAVFGTLLTNPVTIFFVYPIQCWVGNRILGGNLTFNAVKDVLKTALNDRSLQALFDLKWDVIASFLVGGSLFGILLAVPTYYGVLALVNRHRLRKRAKKSSKTQEC